MKTVLHIIDTTGPGGAETVFIDLATYLPTDKYRSIVTIRGKGWVYEELCRRGIKPILLDAKGSFNWRFLLSLRQLVMHENVDLIQSHLLGSSVYSSLVSLITGIPVIATFHGIVDIGEKERFKSLKFGVINRGTKRVIAVSQMLKKEMLERTSLKTSKIETIYNGINTSIFYKPRSNSLRLKYGWSEDDFIVGCLGNIRPAKGYDILLHAAAIVKSNSNRNYRFVIAGQPDNKGELYKSLLELRKKLNLENTVQFLGFLDDPIEFLVNLDLFMSSSISEGLPLSAIQGMSAELPLLATRCGGYEELVTHKENGWLVEVGNPKALAYAIEYLANSAEIRSELAKKARLHVVETFDLYAMLKAYETTYSKVLNV